MRILISNDDGIHAPGIRALAESVSDLGELYIVAPDRQRSASSHGISLYDPLYVEEVDFHLANTHAYSVTGTPVDCVKWGVVVHGAEKPFDLMLSGINEGPNLATDVLYSGTVAAAGEAALQGIPAVALSLAGPPFPFTEAACKVREMLDAISGKTFPPDTFLSINLPPQGLADAPWKATELGVRSFTDRFLEKVDKTGRNYYRYAGEELDEPGGDETDVRTVARGDISVTPLRYRFTNNEMIDTLTSWLTGQSIQMNRS